MPKISISEAARLAGKPRSTIHRHIAKGKLSKDENGLGKPVVDVAELERVYGSLRQADEEQTVATRQSAAPKRDTPDIADKIELEGLRREVALLREQLDDVKQDRDHWRQQATALLTDQREKSLQKATEGRWRRAWSILRGKS